MYPRTNIPTKIARPVTLLVIMLRAPEKLPLIAVEMRLFLYT